MHKWCLIWMLRHKPDATLLRQGSVFYWLEQPLVPQIMERLVDNLVYCSFETLLNAETILNDAVIAASEYVLRTRSDNALLN